MAIVISSGTTLTVAANAKSADQVTGQYQHVGKGKFTLIAYPSVTGVNATCSVGGINLINDNTCPAFGTTGSMSVTDHVVASQVLNGGRVELFFRNTTGAGVTVDYILYFEPM